MGIALAIAPATPNTMAHAMALPMDGEMPSLLFSSNYLRFVSTAEVVGTTETNQT